MTTTQYVLSGKLVTVNIPDNHHSLIIYRENLEKELIACKRRLTEPGTNIQKTNIGREISRIQSELALVNKKISSIKTERSEKLKKKFKDRQKRLEQKGFQPFPEFATSDERYEWALSLLGNAIGLLKGKNRTQLSDEDLIDHLSLSFSAAVNWEKANDLEAAKAKAIYNGN